MKSLERTIVVWLSGILLAVFSALLWFSVHAVSELSESQMATRLEHDSEALLAALNKNPRGKVRLREGRITPIYQQPLSGHYFQFTFSDGTRLGSRSLWDESLETREVLSGEVVIYQEPGPGQQKLLLRTAGYEKLGLKFTLTVAEDMTPIIEDVRYFQFISLFLLGVAMLGIILMQRYVLRRGFQELDKVRRDVYRISSGEIKSLQELGPAEIQPLTAEINRLLKQLQQRLRRSRESLGNLAHSLKGPLSLMVRDIDNLPLSPSDKNKLDSRLARISNLVERELKRARLAGKNIGQFFRPSEDIENLISALKQLYSDKGIAITTGRLSTTPLPLDQEDMLELLGNLLDNACKWAIRTIHVQFSKIDGEVHIQVADDGPGISDEDQSRIMLRGTRVDEQEAGHGLGLAIVKSLVDDYDGVLRLSKSVELGGLEVNVVLPLPGHALSNE